MNRLCYLFLCTLGSVCAQSPIVTGVLNSADYSTHVSPGVIALVSGSNFGTGPVSSVTFTVAGKQGFVAAVSPSQLSVELPIDAAPGAAAITVTVNGTASAPFAVTLDAFSPAFLTANGSGSGPGLIRTTSNVNVTAAAPARPGDTLQAFAVGLGPVTPAVPTGTPASNPSPTVTTPTLTVGGVPAAIIYAGAATGAVATYQITFKVPPGLQGTQPLVLSIGGKTSNPVTVALFGIGSIVSNASFASAGTAAPGSIVSIFGNGFGLTDQSTGFPGTSFQGVSVTFNGVPAPLFHLAASQGQIDLLVPYELPQSATVNVQVATPSGTSPNYVLNMVPAVPGIYFLADPSTKARLNVLAQFNNTAWLAMPAAMAAALNIPSNCAASNVSPLALCGQPAAAGDYLVLYTTGLGRATPNGDPNGVELKTGDVPPADGSLLYKTVVAPDVTVGGLPATVVFSGIAPGFPGEYQIDFQVPAGVTGDDVPVIVKSGGLSDTRTIAIQSK